MTEPAATTETTEQQTEAPKAPSLEESLAALDDDTRKFVLGEVKSARTEAQRLREWRNSNKDKVSEYDRLAEASRTDLERAQATAQAAEQRATRLATLAVTGQVQALAAADFADPTDAAEAIDPAQFIDGDGQIDSDGIRKALADLLTRKPHWRKQPDSRLPGRNPAQGGSGNPAAPDLGPGKGRLIGAYAAAEGK